MVDWQSYLVEYDIKVQRLFPQHPSVGTPGDDDDVIMMS